MESSPANVLTVFKDFLKTLRKFFYVTFSISSAHWKKFFLAKILPVIWETFLYESIYIYNSYTFSRFHPLIAFPYKSTLILLFSFRISQWQGPNFCKSVVESQKAFLF